MRSERWEQPARLPVPTDEAWINEAELLDRFGRLLIIVKKVGLPRLEGCVGRDSGKKS